MRLGLLLFAKDISCVKLYGLCKISVKEVADEDIVKQKSSANSSWNPTFAFKKSATAFLTSVMLTLN
jgi:hypothetical protein